MGRRRAKERMLLKDIVRIATAIGVAYFYTLIVQK